MNPFLSNLSRSSFTRYFLLGTVIWVSQLAFSASNAPVTGSIHGVLHAQDGTVIAGAKVMANKSIPVNAVNSALVATGPTYATAITGRDGSFALANLPAGTYTLCAQAQAALHLDPCHWSETPPKIVLAAGEKVTGYSFNLVKGQALQVRLDDQGGLLASAAGALGNPHVLMGVLTRKGQFYPLPLVGSDSGGRNHALVVPLNTSLRLTVSSPTMKLTDSAGTALKSTGHVVPFRLDSGDSNPQPQVFHVVGKN